VAAPYELCCEKELHLHAGSFCVTGGGSVVQRMDAAEGDGTTAAAARNAAQQAAVGVDAPLLLRVPCESLKGHARERTKVLNTELASLVAEAVAVLPSAASPEDQEAILAPLEARLLALRRSYGVVATAEGRATEQLQARVEHLGAGLDAAANEDTLRAWERVRLDRLLADYLQRSGALSSGTQLASSSGVEALVDTELHSAHAAVVASLRQGDAAAALEWCNTHRSRLVKVRSSLEFRLRMHQLVELIGRGDTKAALDHARTFVGPAAAASGSASEEDLRELQRIMTLLAFREAPAGCEQMLADGWGALATAFMEEAAKLHGMGRVSGLTLRLQAGLVTLNPPHVAHTQRNDPLRDANLARLAAQLPHSKHVHSRVVCQLTGAVMDERNPPAALPNGQVYSRAALEHLAMQSGGEIRCPRTGDGPYTVTQLQKVFLA
jgi:macrophage erythroblast attacher